MDNYQKHTHTLLILGDSSTGKTFSIQRFLGPSAQKIEGEISLYNALISYEQEKVNCVIWDAKGNISNLNYFCLLDQVATILIFCSLQNVRSCDRLGYWNGILERYKRGSQVVIVGTIYRNASDRQEAQEPPRKLNQKLIEKNRIRVLQWCIKEGNIPFVEVELDDRASIKNMYQMIFQDRSKKIHMSRPVGQPA